jgi:hypothetical protein
MDSILSDRRKGLKKKFDPKKKKNESQDKIESQMILNLILFYDCENNLISSDLLIFCVFYKIKYLQQKKRKVQIK